MTRFVAMVLASMVVVVAPASAAQLAIVPPATPPSEDMGFALRFAGAADPGENSWLRAKARRAGGAPCAPSAGSDPGDDVTTENLGNGGGAFERSAAYEIGEPGDYVICAWLGDLFGAVHLGPVSVTMTVRAPNLSMHISAPPRLRPGESGSVGVTFGAEVPRYLTVAFAQTATCGVSPGSLIASPGHDVLADAVNVSGVGQIDRVLTAPTEPGTYRLCAYLSTALFDRSRPAQLVVTGPAIEVVSATRRCRAIGGRRGIRDIRVTGLSCVSGRAVAARWGRARRAPRVVSGFACRRVGGRRVTCRNGERRVSFRYRR